MTQPLYKGYLSDKGTVRSGKEEKLYDLAYHCWRFGYKRAKCMDLAQQIDSNITEAEWAKVFKQMFDEQLSGYTNATK